MKLKEWFEAGNDDIRQWSEELLGFEFQDKELVSLARLITLFSSLTRAGFLMFTFDPDSRRWVVMLTPEGARAWARRTKRTVH